MWDSLCVAIDRPDLVIDPRFENEWDRRSNADELKVEIAAWTMQRTKWEAMEQLGEAGVPAGAVLDTHDLFNNPHFEERGFIHELDHPEHGKIRLLGWAPRLSRSHVPMRRAPLLGEHNGEVLADDLGLGATTCRSSRPPESSAARHRSPENNRSPRGGAVARPSLLPPAGGAAEG